MRLASCLLDGGYEQESHLRGTNPMPKRTSWFTLVSAMSLVQLMADGGSNAEVAAKCNFAVPESRRQPILNSSTRQSSTEIRDYVVESRIAQRLSMSWSALMMRMISTPSGARRKNNDLVADDRRRKWAAARPDWPQELKHDPIRRLPIALSGPGCSIFLPKPSGFCLSPVVKGSYVP